MKEKEITEFERELYWEVWEEQHQFLIPSMANEIENMFNLNDSSDEIN